MVDKIVYTYKFSTLPNIDILRDECKIWLTTILDKYDPNEDYINDVYDDKYDNDDNIDILD